jgi:hypothetical protein
MNKFDQLVKEKVNEIEYPYKSAYWNNFIQSAHWHTMSVGVKIALWSVAGIIGAGGGYAIYYFAIQNNNNQEITAIQSQSSSDTTAQYVDFADSVSCEQKTETEIFSQTNHSSNRRTAPTSDVIQHNDETSSPKNNVKLPDTPTDPTLHIKWRAMTIDVDTIKSNR